jgi:hypothetical protein
MWMGKHRTFLLSDSCSPPVTWGSRKAPCHHARVVSASSEIEPARQEWRLLQMSVCIHRRIPAGRARLLRALLFIAFIWPVACGAFGQTVDFEDSRVPMTELAGPWRFHAGDNPTWENPDASDSGWSLLYAGKSWDEQGYKGYSGVAWYRLRLLDASDGGPLAFYLPSVDESCQVFVNGRLIGQVGSFPPHPRYIFEQRMLFTVPADAVRQHQPIEIAVRIWHSPRSHVSGGGMISVPRIGNAHLIAQWRRLGIHDNWTDLSIGLLHLYGNLLTCAAGFALFLLRRKEREYLWWGCAQLFYALYDGIGVYASFRPVASTGFLWYVVAIYILANYFWLGFYVAFLRQPRNWFFWGVVSILLLSACCFAIWIYQPENLLAGIGYTVGNVFWNASIVVLLWRGARKGNADATFLLVPMSLVFCVSAAMAVTGLMAGAGIPWILTVAQFLQTPVRWRFPIHGGDIAIIVNYAVLFVLVRRFARSRRDEERLHAELEAARAVQEVLIPNEVPAIGGFTV